MIANNNQSTKRGLALYIQNNIPATIKAALTFIRGGIETICADLNTPNGIITVGLVNTPNGIITVGLVNTPNGIITVRLVNTPNGIITVGLVYKLSVHINVENFTIALETIIFSLDPNNKTYIVGDFNINLLYYNNSAPIENFINPIGYLGIFSQ